MNNELDALFAAFNDPTASIADVKRASAAYVATFERPAPARPLPRRRPQVEIVDGIERLTY